MLKRASQVALAVKDLPANAGDVRDVSSLDQDDPLEEGMATLSSILAWKIPMNRRTWRATVLGDTKSRTRLND